MRQRRVSTCSASLVRQRRRLFVGRARLDPGPAWDPLRGGSALPVEHEPDREIDVDRFQVRIVLAHLVA